MYSCSLSLYRIPEGRCCGDSPLPAHRESRSNFHQRGIIAVPGAALGHLLRNGGFHGKKAGKPRYRGLDIQLHQTGVLSFDGSTTEPAAVLLEDSSILCMQTDARIPSAGLSGAQ